MSATTQTATSVATIEPPPDCYAAHLEELPKPGSRIFGAQNALALAIIVNDMDPDSQKHIQHLREDIRALASQNENLDIYSRMMYHAARRSLQEVNRLTERESVAAKQIADSEAACLSLRQAVEKLQLEVAAFAEKLVAAQTTIAQAEARHLGAVEKHAASITEVGELRSKLQEVRALLKTTTDERDACKVELSSLHLSLDQATLNAQSEKNRAAADLAQLTAKFSASLSEVENLQSEITTQKDSTKALQVMNTGLSAQLALVTAERETIVVRLDALGRERDALAAGNTSLDERLVQVGTERDTIAARLNALEGERDALSNSNTDLNERLARFDAERETITAQLEMLRRERDEFATGNIGLSAQLAQVNAESQSIAEQLTALGAKRDALDALAAEASDSKTKLELSSVNCSRLQEELHTLQKTVCDLKAERDQAKMSSSDVQKLEGQIGHLRNSVEFWKSKFNTANAAVDSYSKKWSDIEAQHVVEQERLNNLLSTERDSVEAWKRAARISEVQDRLLRQNVLQERKVLQNECDRLKKELQGLQKERDELKTVNETLLREMNGLRQSRDDARRTASKWQSMHDRANNELMTSKKEAELKASECQSKAAEVEMQSAECLKLNAQLKRTKEILDKNRIGLERNLIALKTVTLQATENQEQVDRLTSRVFEQDTQLKTLYRSRDTLKSQVNQLKKLLEPAQREVSRLRGEEAQAAQLRQDFLLETEQHARARQNVLKLEESLRSSGLDNAALQAKIEKLKWHLGHERKRTGSVLEVKDVRAENKLLCAQIDELEKENAKLQAELCNAKKGMKHT